MTFSSLNYGNSGIILMMGNAGFISSTRRSSALGPNPSSEEAVALTSQVCSPRRPLRPMIVTQVHLLGFRVFRVQGLGLESSEFGILQGLCFFGAFFFGVLYEIHRMMAYYPRIWVLWLCQPPRKLLCTLGSLLTDLPWLYNPGILKTKALNPKPLNP